MVHLKVDFSFDNAIHYYVKDNQETGNDILTNFVSSFDITVMTAIVLFSDWENLLNNKDIIFITFQALLLTSMSVIQGNA